MDLKLKELAELLQISTKTIYRWINNGKIPYYRINHQYRFRTDEINKWASSNRIDVSLDNASETEVSVQKAIQNGGIYYDITGNSVQDVLANSLEVITLPPELKNKELLAHLLGREEMASTGVGNGIAFPHPREPLVTRLEDELVSILFLRNPVDYKALDDIPVKTMFLILSSNQKRHLQLLSQLSHLCRQDDFITLLQNKSTRQEFMVFLNILKN